MKTKMIDVKRIKTKTKKNLWTKIALVDITKMAKTDLPTLCLIKKLPVIVLKVITVLSQI